MIPRRKRGDFDISFSGRAFRGSGGSDGAGTGLDDQAWGNGFLTPRGGLAIDGFNESFTKVIRRDAGRLDDGKSHNKADWCDGESNVIATASDILALFGEARKCFNG